MIIFGIDIRRATKAAPANLVPPPYGGNTWWPIIREPFPQAWQRNVSLSPETVMAYHAVYSCVTLIAADISKMRLRLMEEDADGISVEVEAPAFSPLLRRPNRYQNSIQFFEYWMVSKLLQGNTYALKVRDARNVVVALHILDPRRAKPLVAPDGGVYYEVTKDNLSGLSEQVVVIPASEIIHDRMKPLYHPLVGVTPLTACGIPALQGLKIQDSSTKFFENGAKPGGVLTAPGTIDDVTAERFKREWEEKFSGNNAGRVAVLGDGLKYEPMAVNAVDAQLIEQLKWSAQAVCSAFHVPPYMIGVGDPPSYNNIEALNQQYYAQCLQTLIEAIEALFDDGLGLRQSGYETEFDLDDLLRMDTAARIKGSTDAIKGGLSTPNEERARFNMKPVTGGDAVYLQQQNFSLEALAKRDAQADPFTPGGGPAPAAPSAAPAPPARAAEMRTAMARALGLRSLPLH